MEVCSSILLTNEGRLKDFHFSFLFLFLFLFVVVFVLEENHFVQVQQSYLEDNAGACLINVSKIYDGHKIALSNVCLHLPRNKVTCLLGRNGAGKSTLM